jgi:hypothetical protein
MVLVGKYVVSNPMHKCNCLYPQAENIFTCIGCGQYWVYSDGKLIPVSLVYIPPEQKKD